MRVTIRKFEKTDIPTKIKWVNNPANNAFLHYDIPIEIEKTERWFDNNLGRKDRYDGLIEADGVSVGLIGLLSIDQKNRKAEYYILIGEIGYKGKGIAKEASRQIIDYGFHKLGLNRIYLFTETENITAHKLFERVGFVKEGCLKSDLFSHGKYVDRYAYSVLRGEWVKEYGLDSNSESGAISE